MKQFHVLFPKQKKTRMFSHEVILTSSPDGPIMAYESSTGAVVAQFTGSRSPCRGITMAGHGLIAASHVSPDTGSGSIHLYNWYTPTMFHSLPISEPVAPLAATPDGAFLFAGGISGSVHSISLPSSDIIKSFAAHSRSVSSLHVSDDGSLVISGSDDGTIVVTPTFRLVDEALLQQHENPKDFILHQWKAHSNSVTAFNSTIELCSSVLVSCSLDCTCKFWSLSNGTLLRTVEFPCAILGFSVDDDSTESRFYAAGADGLVYKVSRKKMDTENRANYEMVTNTWSKKRHGGSIVSLVMVNGGRNLVSAAEELGSVWMWNEEGEVTMVLGNEYMGRSISDMIVAKCGTSSSSTSGVVRKGIDFATGGGGFISSLGLCDEEMVRTLKQIVELGDFMDVAVQDKRRAIDMLESAIAMYERLLRLILKEATKAIEAEEEEEKYEKEDK